MPRISTILDIFVSSPSDIIDEREIIKDTVKELNELHSKQSNIMLNLLDYETSVFPDVGGTYAQENVTNQIGDYDIFIGILWTRFGTPTPNPNTMSGTEEEFNIAMERYENREVSNVGFYFSNVEIDPRSIDFKEYQNVINFKKKKFNPDSKNLRYDYSSLEQFKNKIRRHLETIILKQDSINEIDNLDKEKNKINEKAPKNQIKIDDEKLGVIDNIEGATKNFEITTNNIEDLAIDMEDLGNKVTLRSKKVDPNNISSVKRNLNLISEDMNEFVKNLQEKRSEIYDNFSEGINGFFNAIAVIKNYNLSKEEYPEQTKTWINEIKSIENGIDDAINGFNSFKINIEELPPLTVKFNKSKRDMLRSADEFISDLKDMKEMVNNFERETSKLQKGI